MIHSLLSKLQKQKGVFFVIAWLTIFELGLKIALDSKLNPDVDRQQQSEILLQALPTVIQANDSVFLASQNQNILKELRGLSSKVYYFEPVNNNVGFDASLIDWLDRQCQNTTVSYGWNYFIWTDDQDDTIELLGYATRKLTFFASFEAIIPYQSKQANIVDKIILLNLRIKIINQYCEAKRLAGNLPALVIVNANEFPPVIGSVEVGNITWLASNENRILHRENYVVKNFPSFLQFAAWSTNFASVWSFKNQETKAYNLITQEIRRQKGLVLVDQSAALGEVPAHFLKKCSNSTIVSTLFRQFCLK